jgi:hypothetical protein
MHIMLNLLCININTLAFYTYLYVHLPLENGPSPARPISPDALTNKSS